MDDPVLFRQGGFRLAARMRGAGANVDESQVRRLREFAQREDQAADALVAWSLEGRDSREDRSARDNRKDRTAQEGRDGRGDRPAREDQTAKGSRDNPEDRSVRGSREGRDSREDRPARDDPESQEPRRANTNQEQLELALTQGIDAVSNPAPQLEAFFRQVEATPYWVDRERLQRGAKAITRAGLLGLFPLGDMSLMGGYLASRATKSLVGTGEIEYRATRRLIETATWWIDVTTPGAMAKHQTGYAAAIRIRLVHAHVRRAMNEREDWDYEAWDRPVNQVQTAGTLLLFSLVYVFGTQLLGLRYSARERADILHLWRYIGWLMGVDEELLPAGEDDAWRLLWLLAATEFIPDADSKRLAKALVDSHASIGEGGGAAGKVLGQVNVGVHSAISRLVLGKNNADFLELPNDLVAQAAVLAAAGLNFAAETVRLCVPGATALQERIGGAGRRFYLKRLREVLKPDTSYKRHMRAA